MSESEATIPAAAAETSTAPAVDPQDEARLRGISKSIVIGLGGTGHKIVLDVRKRLVEKYGTLDVIPIVSFIQVDTDGAVLARNVNYSEEVNLRRSEIIHATVAGVENLKNRLNDYPHLRSWLKPAALTGDIYQGAGAIRAQGRLAYFWNYAEFTRRLAEAYRQVTKDESISSANRKGLVVGEGVTVYIVGSLLGGTGSGVFLDIAYTVRDQLRGNPNLEIVGIFSIPPNSQAVPADNRPNAYASLLELNHFTDPSTEFEAQYTADTPPIRDARPPFHYCYLEDVSNPQIQLNSVDDLVAMIGHGIFLDLTSEFQRQKKSNRDNFKQYMIVGDELGCPQNYCSMGLAAIHFPADKVRAACANRLAKQVVTGWMTPLDRAVNIATFTDQELDRLGLQPEQVTDQCLKVNVESGETLRDSIAQYWRQVNRQYMDQYPGHERVSAWLSEKDHAFSERFVDNDPNPDLRLKRRENLGEFPRIIQANITRLLPAKQEALREMVSRIVSDPAHRHGVAEEVLQAASDRFRAWIKERNDAREAAAETVKPTADGRDRSLGEIQRFAGDRTMRLVPGATRRSIDEQETVFVQRAQRANVSELEGQAATAAALVYDELLRHVELLKAELARYIELLRQARTHFSRAEAMSVNLPVRVVGEVLFNPGHRMVDDSGEEVYQGGDIDERFQAYAGQDSVRLSVASKALKDLNVSQNIYALRDTDLPRLASVIYSHAESVFDPVENESVLEKFFQKYPGEEEAKAVLQKVVALSAPFMHAPKNAANYRHNDNKEQAIIGIMNGSQPQSEAEKRFARLVRQVVPNLHAQNWANNAEQHQALFLRERAAFPLRLLEGLPGYRYNYDQERQRGATANPMHSRFDILHWLRIDPPTIEEQRAAWRTFVVAWAAGLIDEVEQVTRTSTGSRSNIGFQVSYRDNFGMPKTDLLGYMPSAIRAPAGAPLVGAPPPAAEDEDERDRSLPPVEAREVVIRICDDRTLHEQIRRAIRQKIEAEGVQAFGDQLIRHSEAQHDRLAPHFYDSYYYILAGDPKQDPPVEGYLSEIGYAGRSEPAGMGYPLKVSPPPAAGPVSAMPGDGPVPEFAGAAGSTGVICPICGTTLPAGSRFCPKDGPLPVGSGAIEKYCPSCPGRQFQPDDRFCNLHGELLTRSATPLR
jgi:hypothetical protein